MTIDTIRQTIGFHDSRQGAARLAKLGVLAGALLSALERWAERRRSRLALLELTDDQLKDIGLSRADAWHEGHRSIWDRE